MKLSCFSQINKFCRYYLKILLFSSKTWYISSTSFSVRYPVWFPRDSANLNSSVAFFGLGSGGLAGCDRMLWGNMNILSVKPLSIHCFGDIGDSWIHCKGMYWSEWVFQQDMVLRYPTSQTFRSRIPLETKLVLKANSSGGSYLVFTYRFFAHPLTPTGAHIDVPRELLRQTSSNSPQKKTTEGKRKTLTLFCSFDNCVSSCSISSSVHMTRWAVPFSFCLSPVVVRKRFCYR